MVVVKLTINCIWRRGRAKILADITKAEVSILISRQIGFQDMSCSLKGLGKVVNA